MGGHSPEGSANESHRRESLNPQKVMLRQDGFDLSDGKTGLGIKTVRWNEVRQICAYKRDFLTTDCVYLILCLDDGSCVEICEETPGFNDLMAGMGAAFPEVPKTWVMDVAVPAFVPNETILYPFNADAYAALQTERRAAVEREAERRRRWPDVPMIDWLCMAVGVGVLIGCLQRGACLWAWLVFPCGVLTVASSFVIRRVYRVEPSFRRVEVMVSIVLKRCGYSDGEIRRQQEHSTSRSFWKAVPLAVAVPFTILRFLNAVLLLAALVAKN
jgi:hypothetical protein